MARKRNALFLDQYGHLRDGWAFAGILIGVLLAAALLIVAIVAIAKPFIEAGCNQKGEQYGLEADFRLLSNTCYVTLPNGRKIDAAQIRGVEVGR